MRRTITLDVVSPGSVDTELFGQEQKATFVRLATLGWVGQPDDIAAVLAMLVGPDAG